MNRMYISIQTHHFEKKRNLKNAVDILRKYFDIKPCLVQYAFDNFYKYMYNYTCIQGKDHFMNNEKTQFLFVFLGGATTAVK